MLCASASLRARSVLSHAKALRRKVGELVAFPVGELPGCRVSGNQSASLNCCGGMAS
jgi:hypothetical protein